MIEISLYTAIGIYGSLMVAAALAVWIYTEVNAQRIHRVLENQNLWRCSFCGYAYLNEDVAELSKCPRCGSLNRIDDAGVKPYAVESAGPEYQPNRAARNTSKSKQKGARSRGPRR